MSRQLKRTNARRHWGTYDMNTFGDRYRFCLECQTWRRAGRAKPLIHKGGKPR